MINAAPLREQQVGGDTKNAEISWELTPFGERTRRRVEYPVGGNLGREAVRAAAMSIPVLHREEVATGNRRLWSCTLRKVWRALSDGGPDKHKCGGPQLHQHEGAHPKNH